MARKTPLELFREYGDRIAVVDTETTGLDPSKDEVLSLSIVSLGGEVLFDSLVKPQKRKRWPKAQEINGISPTDVKECETLLDMADDVLGYFDGSWLVAGYNVKFDVDMLKASGLGIGKVSTFDVMGEFSKLSDQKCTLAECADVLGYGQFDAHGSLEDAKATAYCMRKIVASDRYAAIDANMARGLGKGDAKVIAAQQSASGCIVSALMATAMAFLAAILVVAS